MQRRTWMLLALGALMITALVVMRVLPARPVAWHWYTARVTNEPLELSVTATGTLTAVQTVEVGTQVSGTIARLAADFNSVVQQGQVVAELDRTVLQASLDDARATLLKAHVEARQRRREWERARVLYEHQVSARTDFEAAQTAHEAARAAVASAETQLRRARINLEYATIRAPIAGVVVDRKVDVGQTVAASFTTPTLFTIAHDLTQMQVEADVDEADIGQVRVGQAVRFGVDAFPGRTFRGTVRQVRLQPVVTQRVVTYTVVIAVPNPDRLLLPGLTANLTIATAQYPAASTVPAGALTFTPPAAYFERRRRPLPPPAVQEVQPGAVATVWVLAADSLRPVRVRVGATDGVSAQVGVLADSGLRAGQQVVTGVPADAVKKATSFLPPAPGGGKGGGPSL